MTTKSKFSIGQDVVLEYRKNGVENPVYFAWVIENKIGRAYILNDAEGLSFDRNGKCIKSGNTLPASYYRVLTLEEVPDNVKIVGGTIEKSPMIKEALVKCCKSFVANPKQDAKIVISMPAKKGRYTKRYFVENDLNSPVGKVDKCQDLIDLVTFKTIEVMRYILNNFGDNIDEVIYRMVA